MPLEHVNVSIGRQIAERRRELGLSLAELSQRSGVSLQQIHKYETGRNAVSAARLVTLGTCLRVPVVYFFEKLPARPSGRSLG